MWQLFYFCFGNYYKEFQILSFDLVVFLVMKLKKEKYNNFKFFGDSLDILFLFY